LPAADDDDDADAPPVLRRFFAWSEEPPFAPFEAPFLPVGVLRLRFSALPPPLPGARVVEPANVGL
jgi:hypothetical protein